MARSVTARQRHTCECLNKGFFYADEPEVPCDCEGCANYKSDVGYDYSDNSSTSDEDSDYSSTAEVPEQAQPLQLDEMTSVADLKALLQKQCPEEYAALPKIADSEFDDWQDGRARKHLHIGAIRTPFDITGRTVYAFICGDDSNRTGLTQGPDNKPHYLKDASDVDLAEPFRSICWTGRLIEHVEKRRLRALLCFWFFSAGHLSNFKKYKDFEKHLVESVKWLGRAMIEQEASKTSETARSVRDPNAPAVQHPSPAKKRIRPSEQKQSKAEIVKASAKRTKLERAVSAMQQRQDEQLKDLATIESELVALKHSMEPQADLENTVTEQGKKISELERRLYDERAALAIARGQVIQQSHVADAAKIQLQQMETEKKKAEATATTESILRTEAERKLKEYIDAQKKMASQFA